jgi:cell division protein FtsL
MGLSRAFVTLWTVATIATVSAFVLHLALRGRTVALGYELGHARAESARLRDVKRVLSVEAASYKTPERVEIVARTLLGMEPPPPSRVVSLSPVEGIKDRPVTASALGTAPP